jgi:hypothetical protein
MPAVPAEEHFCSLSFVWLKPGFATCKTRSVWIEDGCHCLHGRSGLHLTGR